MVYVAFLRAVNVAGKVMPMAGLRAVAEKLGFTNARTVLASGNLIFESPKRANASLEGALEAEIARRFGMRTDVVVRSVAELVKTVDRCPFPREAVDDPAHVVVYLLKEKVAAASGKQLEAAIVGDERTSLDSNTLYAVYPNGIGRSKLTVALIDRKLGIRGTGRNWNTILRLLAAAQ